MNLFVLLEDVSLTFRQATLQGNDKTERKNENSVRACVAGFIQRDFGRLTSGVTLSNGDPQKKSMGYH